MVSSVPSSARASATDTATGPATVAITVFDSARPSRVHTAPGLPQAAPGASVSTMSPYVLGCTVSSHRSLRSPTGRPGSSTRPPATATP